MTRVAKKYGATYTWEIKVQLMGRPGKEGNKIAVDLMKLPITPEQFYEEQQIHKEELFPQTNVLPGIKYILSFFRYKLPIHYGKHFGGNLFWWLVKKTILAGIMI